MKETWGMGHSAGRSRGNRDGQGSVRRTPQRERAAIDPPGRAERARWADEEEHRTWVWTPRGEKVLSVTAWLCLIALSLLLGVVVSAWWGLI